MLPCLSKQNGPACAGLGLPNATARIERSMANRRAATNGAEAAREKTQSKSMKSFLCWRRSGQTTGTRRREGQPSGQSVTDLM